MLLKALSFLIGVMLVQQLSDLSGYLIPVVAFGLMLVLAGFYWSTQNYHLRRLFQMLAFVCAGIGWTSLHALIYLEHKLPEQLAGQDVFIEGVIRDIPAVNAHVQRFMLEVEKFELDDKTISAPQKLRLSWYYGPKINAGERWRFQVRLKPPHGFSNPGGFDYEGWLFQHGVHATGYIRKSPENSKLADASVASIDATRQQISRHIQQLLSDQPQRGLITALAVGDRSPIKPADWDTLIRTGTNHLMAISGLHIGLAAAFGFWLVRRLIPSVVMKRVPAQQLAMAAGLFIAVVYALLAGLSIPTQRALLMLSCIVGMWLLKRHFRALNALALSLLLVLLWNPISVLSPGFWFSFLAVSVIMYVFSGRLSKAAGVVHRFKQWGWMQFTIALALLPLSMLFFQQASLISPLANFILVPYVSFLVVPLILLALLLMPVSTIVSDYLFIAANELLSWIWPLIEALSMHPLAYWVKAAPEWPALLLAVIGVVLLLAPKGFPVRWLGAVMMLPVLLNGAEKPAVGDFELAMLDVGQGLSVVVRTHNHVLVFDSGNKFGARLDAGKSVVIPFLRHWSVNRLDKLVISHGDADHIGGAAAILAAYPDAELIGQDIEKLIAINKKDCLRGGRWSWDGVEFEFLHPEEKIYSQRNNHSCVLKVSAAGGSVLITGDIEAEAETELIDAYGEQLQAEVLLVPHHGSKTSSTPAFISAVQAQTALFSLGYRNRYRHPHAAVVARYRQAGTAILQSGHVGAVKILFDSEQGPIVQEGHRNNQQKYWNHKIID